MQDPTVIEGVSNSEFLRTARSEITGEKVNLYTFIKFFCDNKIKWDINKGISCLGTFIPGAFSKNDIINYISKIIRDYNKKNNKINVNEQILIKNNIKPFRNNIYDIYYNLYYANEWLIMNKFNK